ncbi:hypothetical protein [Streptosporangium sp. NBC_01756]|uniref:hypothetical protein n=1 Tax=Streptosporangium sp. NBC_01756 TaxID=2975950 RepID=UPI002DD96175|nr:hypothetical protein [Streptosporangium sp. NBC_01756]WSC85920.1 hypothetical protein OIE48_37080 [Streptosporangium sp. NBC_01756]
MKDPNGSDDVERSKEEGQHGYSPDVGHASEEAVRGADRAWGPPPGDKGPGREVSEEEEEGVPATDMEAESPHGVGVSSTRRAEETARKEEEEGRRTTGVDEKTGRPYGTSTPESSTGVDPQGSIDEESPDLPPGDTA